ncbi:MAG TPA: hypothetical protein VFX49_06380 [Chloroflexota bacterium]|nr:hypothetical protein [Chloroflexota bacterium]
MMAEVVNRVMAIAMTMLAAKLIMDLSMCLSQYNDVKGPKNLDPPWGDSRFFGGLAQWGMRRRAVRAAGGIDGEAVAGGFEAALDEGEVEALALAGCRRRVSRRR